MNNRRAALIGAASTEPAYSAFTGRNKAKFKRIIATDKELVTRLDEQDKEGVK